MTGNHVRFFVDESFATLGSCSLLTKCSEGPLFPLTTFIIKFWYETLTLSYKFERSTSFFKLLRWESLSREFHSLFLWHIFLVSWTRYYSPRSRGTRVQRWTKAKLLQSDAIVNFILNEGPLLSPSLGTFVSESVNVGEVVKWGSSLRFTCFIEARNSTAFYCVSGNFIQKYLS